MLLPVVGCSDGGSAAGDADALDAADTNEVVVDTTTVDTVTPNPCDRPNSATVDHRVVLRGTYRCSPPSTPNDVVLTQEADWSAMLDGLSDCISPPASAESVDFDSKYVVVLGTHDFMTCGYDYHAVVALSGDTGPYVELEVTDRSAGCPGACASGMGYVVAVALPRDAGPVPRTCIWVHPGCP